MKKNVSLSLLLLTMNISSLYADEQEAVVAEQVLVATESAEIAAPDASEQIEIPVVILEEVHTPVVASQEEQTIIPAVVVAEQEPLVVVEAAPVVEQTSEPSVAPHVEEQAAVVQQEVAAEVAVEQPVVSEPVVVAPVEVARIIEPLPVLPVVAELDPQLVWNYFAYISQIPRGSYNEAAIAQFIMDEAQKCYCTVRKDSVGNVIVQKPASDDRYAQAPIVVIQSHLDMVCEKNKNVTHDFTKDPIRFVFKDNHLYADGTTLGADNGLGVAAALAIMRSTDLVHGPLEFLFTVVEEAGFDGAKNVTADTIKGRILLNIDTEEEGSLYVGCAGSACVIASAEINREQLYGSFAYYSIVVDGLRGGHSGVDINQGRCNALQIASKLLHKLKSKGINFRLVSIDGGNKRNAIARDTEIILAVEKSCAEAFEKKARLLKTGLLMDFKRQECKMSVTVTPIACDKQVMSLENQERIMKLMDVMPHGVVTMSKFIKDLVQTSTNFASVKTHDACVVFETMQRSLVGAETDAIAKNICQVCMDHGFNTTITDGSPEWQPNEHSLAMKMAQITYRRLFGKEMAVKAIHAGLECGAFVRQVPGLDAISFGPTIYDAHSPSEHVDIATVKPFWLFLTQLVADIARQHCAK